MTEHSVLAAALKSQFHAALRMLRGAIDQCPDDLWASDRYCNPFWRVAYHTLYFLHFYIQRKAEDFTPWQHHQTGIQDLDDVPAPPELIDLVELPHRPPQTGEPYTKEEILEYWHVCADMIDNAVDELDLSSPDSGFSWYKMPKAEHQLVALRHLQHHTGQLTDRIRTATNTGVAWAGARSRR
jgi:hypothetical protein